MTSTIRQVDYSWKLRQVMAEHGMFQTTELAPLLAERGIELSPVQVYRLVAQTPERLNLRVLAALCDIFDCTPEVLIETTAQPASSRRRRQATTSPASGDDVRARRPIRARIVDDAT